jgi:hypothetical protein
MLQAFNIAVTMFCASSPSATSADVLLLLFCCCYFPGGVLPNIHNTLLPAKSKAKIGSVSQEF